MFDSEREEVYLDDSCVFLVPRDFVESRVIRSFADVADFAIGIELVAIYSREEKNRLTRR